MIAWFICPYIRKNRIGLPSRYCAMDDFTAQLIASGGDWKEVEILGNRAIVKVRASAAALRSIAETATFRRMPTNKLDDPLSTLTQKQRDFLRNEVLDAGYTIEEFRDTHPDMKAITLRQVLKFLARRRLKPRYDKLTDTIVFTGPEIPVKDTDLLDSEI